MILTSSARINRNQYTTAPAWGLLFVIIGGIASTLLIPGAEYDQPGALAPAALIMTLGLLSGGVVAGMRSPISLVRCEYVLMFGLVYWLVMDMLQGEVVYGVSRDALVRAFTAIWCFAAAIWLGSVFSALQGSSRAQLAESVSKVSTIGPRFLFVAALTCGLFAIFRYVIACEFSPDCLIDSFYQKRFAAPWRQVDAFGPFDTLFWFGNYVGMLVLPLTAALVASERRLSWRAWVTLLLGLVVLVYQVRDGGRKDIGTVIGGALLVWVLTRRKVRIRHLAGIAIGMIALVVTMQFMLVARDRGIATALDEGFYLMRPGEPLAVVDRNIRYLTYGMDLVPERFSYNGMAGIVFTVTRSIPFDLGINVNSLRVDLPTEMGLRYGRGYSWTTTAIGDLYLINGFMAIVIGGLGFGYLAGRASRLLLAPNSGIRTQVVYSLSTMTLFLSLRALHEFFLTGTIVVIFILFLAVRGVLIYRLAKSRMNPNTIGVGGSKII